MIVIKCCWHPIIGKNQKRQSTRADLIIWSQMAHQRLKKGLIGGLCGFKKIHHITPPFDKFYYGFDCAPPQAPPLTANLHLNIVWNFST